MQPNENFSVSRRALDIEDYIDVIRRHKGWIFGPFLLTLVASVVGVYLYPDSYVSQAVVKIVPQQVPTNMVQSAINQLMSDRINSMAGEIMSRTVLTTIINTFDLYKRERGRMPVEDVIEIMKKNIQITPAGNPGNTTGTQADRLPAFAVQFSYENRLVAQRVVQDLVSRFIDANIRNRSNAVFQTTQFMKDELDEAKKQLDEASNKLAAFRMTNNGRLPDQVGANMQQLSALESQVTYLNSTINRANQEKMQYESNIRIFKDQMAALTKDPGSVGIVQKSDRLAEAERDANAWENQLSALRQKYKDTFPDVQTAVARLANARKKRDDIMAEEKAGKSPGAPSNPVAAREERELDANIRRLETAMQTRDIEITNAQKELKRASEAMRAYQGRIETVPMGEKEYGDLMRDRDLSKEKFIELNSKLEKAQIAQEMESRKQGETLELLDPPSLPTTPTEPKRTTVILAGGVLGLLIGFVIASARELRDTSLKNLKDVRAYTHMAILGSVPLLENDFVVRRRRRMTWLGWTTACVAAAVVMSASVVYYYVTKV